MRLDTPTDATKPRTRICRKCGEEKLLEEFYEAVECRWGYTHRCRICTAAYQRVYNKQNKPEVTKRQREHYKTVKGKAAAILQHMRRTSRLRGFAPPQFTLEEIRVLIQGSCAKTGIPFDREYKSKGMRNPWAPSPDRIDAKVGYTKENVQWVCWMYNLMKADFSEEEVSLFVNKLRTLQ